MVFRVLSGNVKKRFPLMKDLVDAGLLTKNELAIIEDMDRKFPGYGKNWMPIVWAATLVTRARTEGRIKDDFAAKTIIDELNKFRGSCSALMSYNAIYIPLVYTQIVGIAVYFYFIVKLISQQYIYYPDTVNSNGTVISFRDDSQEEMFNIDYCPILIILEFIFYMGWLKVAETMLNPFGNDDDDFELNDIIDHNLQTSYLIVDHMHNEHPELLKGKRSLGILKKYLV
jgi:bestrophin, other